MEKYLKNLHLLENKNFIDKTEVDRFILFAEEYLGKNAQNNNFIFEHLYSLINSMNSVVVKSICYKLLSHSSIRCHIESISEDLLMPELTDYVLDYINGKDIEDYNALIYNTLILQENYFSRGIFDFFRKNSKYSQMFLATKSLSLAPAQLEVISFQNSLNFDLEYFLQFLASPNKFLVVKAWESFKMFEKRNSMNLNLPHVALIGAYDGEDKDNKLLGYQESVVSESQIMRGEGLTDDVEIMDFDYLFDDSFNGDCCALGCPEF